MASLNVNGARDIGKRFKLYEIIKQKKIDVLLVQETHSDILNSSDWAKEFDGLSVLSHLTSTSGGGGGLPFYFLRIVFPVCTR